jgi:acetyl/propionyl-CoA carboxylase alpha subunit
VATRAFDVRCGDEVVRVDALADGTLRAAGVPARVEAVAVGQWRVVVNGTAHHVFAAGPAEAPWIWHDGVVYRPEVSDSERPARTRSRDTSGSLSAPMPATVRAIAIAPGAHVACGDTLVVLEAMKMELPLKSPVDGVVVSVACQVGDLVQPGVPLVELA